jgi:hypothetical protein
MRRRERLQQAGAAGGEIRTRSAGNARQLRCCRRARHRVVPRLWPSSRARPRRTGERYGPELTLLDWRERLVCSQCGSREIDMVVSGAKR